MATLTHDVEDTQIVTKRRTTTKPTSQPLPVYKLILHNDDYNTFPFVIRILVQVVPCSTIKATWLALQAHCSGCSIIWTGCLELAELKADQIKTFGADPEANQEKVHPLRVTIEPA